VGREVVTFVYDQVAVTETRNVEQFREGGTRGCDYFLAVTSQVKVTDATDFAKLLWEVGSSGWIRAENNERSELFEA
jgi:hypothetical protein